MDTHINKESLKLSKDNTVSDAVDALSSQEISTKDLSKKNQIKRDLDKFKNKKAGAKLTRQDIERVENVIFNKKENSSLNSSMNESRQDDLNGIKRFIAKVSTNDFAGCMEELKDVYQNKIENRYKKAYEESEISSED